MNRNHLSIKYNCIVKCNCNDYTNLSGQVALAQQQGEQPMTFIVQNTTKSMQDPLPGHESHQIVIAAPPRDDGNIYSGIASYTASQPVEVVLLQSYKAVANSTETDEPLNAPFGDGKVAISLIIPPTTEK